MKKILLLFILAPLCLFSQSFEVMQIKVSDASMKNDYEKFEAMWANAHEEIHKKGNKVGWFFFKVILRPTVLLAFLPALPRALAM